MEIEKRQLDQLGISLNKVIMELELVKVHIIEIQNRIAFIRDLDKSYSEIDNFELESTGFQDLPGGVGDAIRKKS